MVRSFDVHETAHKIRQDGSDAPAQAPRSGPSGRALRIVAVVLCVLFWGAVIYATFG